MREEGAVTVEGEREAVQERTGAEEKIGREMGKNKVMDVYRITERW